MATQSLISASYSEAVIVNFTQDAWFNAVTVAAPFGKLPKDWLKTDDTQAYIQAIRKILLIEENQLLSVKRGSPENGGGTWFHPKLAIPFARWLSPEFGVWCDMQIEAILKARTPYGLKELPAPKTKKALPGCLTCEQQDTIKALVKSRVEACPKAKQGAAAITCWSSIKSKFGVGYKEVPAEHFQDVLSLVARLELPLEGEHIPAAQAVPAMFNGNLLVEVKDGRIAWARSIGPDEYLMTDASFKAKMERIGMFLVDAGDEDAVTAFAEQHITSAANSYRVALTCLSKLANRTIHQAS